MATGFICQTTEQRIQSISEFSYYCWVDSSRTYGKASHQFLKLYSIMLVFTWRKKLKEYATFWNRNQYISSVHTATGPVKLVFGISKKRIQLQDEELQINFGNPSGKKAVMKSLRNLDVKTCCKIWTKFTKISKSCIIEARDLLDLKILSNQTLCE